MYNKNDKTFSINQSPNNNREIEQEKNILDEQFISKLQYMYTN